MIAFFTDATCDSLIINKLGINSNPIQVLFVFDNKVLTLVLSKQFTIFRNQFVFRMKCSHGLFYLLQSSGTVLSLDGQKRLTILNYYTFNFPYLIAYIFMQKIDDYYKDSAAILKELEDLHEYLLNNLKLRVSEIDHAHNASLDMTESTKMLAHNAIQEGKSYKFTILPDEFFLLRDLC